MGTSPAMDGLTMPARKPEQIADDIEAYLDQRPQATDTAEGIAAWWVQGRTTTVRLALGLLIERGQLEVSDAGGATRYRKPQSEPRLRVAAAVGHEGEDSSADSARKAG